MSPPLDELYLTWLYSETGSVRLRTPSRTHWALLRQLYTKEFVWLIPNDDNRVEDGKELRYEFLELHDIQDAEQSWIEIGCSMLEVMIGLSRRLAFEAEGKPRDWFWVLVKNLNLFDGNDKTPLRDDYVSDVLDRVIWRTYLPDGSGGLFPLKEPEDDQRERELWYQLSAYVIELE